MSIGKCFIDSIENDFGTIEDSDFSSLSSNNNSNNSKLLDKIEIDPDDPRLTKLGKLLDQIKLNLEKQLANTRGSKLESAIKRKSEIKDIKDNLNDLDQLESINFFIVDTLKVFRNLEKKFNDIIEISKKELNENQKKNIMNSLYSLLDSINSYTILDEMDQSDILSLFDNSSNVTKIDINEMSPQAMITESISIRQKIKKEINYTAIPLLASFILKQKPNFSNAKILEQIEVLKNRIINVQNLNKNEEKKKKRIYELEIEINKLKSYTLDEESLIEKLKSTNLDEDLLSYLLNPLISSPDNVIALFAKTIKSEFEIARIKDINIKRETANVLQKYISQKGRTLKIKDQYADIIEEVDEYEFNNNSNEDSSNDKITKLSFVQKYNMSKFNKAKYEFQLKLGIKPDKENEAELTEYKKKKNDWYKLNTQIDLDAQILNKQIATANLNNNIISNKEYIRQIGKKFYMPAEQYANPKWKTLYNDNNQPKNESGKLHKYITELYLKQQESVPKFKQNGYIVPSIPKTQNERLQMNLIKGIGQSVSEAFTVKAYDDEFGQLSESSALSGEGFKNIPVFFNSQMSIEEVSYDVVASVLQYSAMANKFNSLNQINSEIQLFKKVIGDRNIEKVDSKGVNILDSFAEKLKIKDVFIKNTDEFSGNSKRHLDAFIDMIIYNESQNISTTNFLGLNIDTGKLTNTALNIAALTSIAADLLKGVANNLQGNIQLIIEASGGAYFNLKNLSVGKKNFFANTTGAVLDFGKMTPESFQGKLVELYDPMQGEFRDEYGRVISASVFRKLFSTSTLFFNQHFGEYEIAVSNMYALMDATKVLDLENKSIISLYEAYKKYGVDSLENKVEMLLLDAKNQPYKENDSDNYASIPFTENVRIDIQNRLHALSKRMQGIYNSFDKSVAQKYSIGRLLLMYRKHLAPGILRRYKRLGYDIELGDITEGFYRTFSKTMIRDLRDMKFNIIKNWSTYSEFEKSAILRTLSELTIVILLTVSLALLLSDDDDDEDKNSYISNFLIYEMTRMRSETFAYINPGDFKRTISSPTAMLSIVNRLSKFISQIFDPFEKYERKTGNALKGDYKIWVYFKRLMGLSGYNFNPEEATKIYNSITER